MTATHKVKTAVSRDRAVLLPKRFSPGCPVGDIRITIPEIAPIDCPARHKTTIERAAGVGFNPGPITEPSHQFFW
jgi:hypothetical protein